MESLLSELDTRRKTATEHLDPSHRSALGQFFTPASVASFMASLIEPASQGKSLHILDPGAGIGALSAALLEHLHGHGHVTAYEIEPTFQVGLQQTLSQFGTQHQVINADFIAAAITTITNGKSRCGLFDVAILNPPYKKIQSNSAHRSLLRKIGVETSNLYTCFLAAAIALCKPGAQIVAIVPRSWMNGSYFKPFRYWLLEHVALTHIHIFDARNKAFADDEVLQENVIIRLVVNAPQASVTISASNDHSFTDTRTRVAHFSEVVHPGDDQLFIHVPLQATAADSGLTGVPLRELGLDVCTGPVVDFRLKEHLRMEAVANSAPLLYSSHFVDGQLQWPRQTRKPNAIMVNAVTRQWLMPNGCYVVLRRFTSKEEKRRVVANILTGAVLPGEWLGFENHLNVIHQDKQGLEPLVAQGLVAYLNSEAVDTYFRTFSGHTQVNATDLRRLRFPTLEALRELAATTHAQKRNDLVRKNRRAAECQSPNWNKP